MSKKNNLSRRQFLNYAASSSIVGLCRSPAKALFATILGGMSQRAWAQSLGLAPRNLIDLCENGGPARWMCNTFLSPYSSAGINPAPMVGTRFKNVGGRYIGVQYETVRQKGIDVPWMWSHELPSANGSTRPMADLLDNLLCIQGINTRNAGHASSQLWHMLPVGALKSTSALSADASNAPFAALNINAPSFVFRSTESKTALSVSTSGNMLSTLLDPFRPAGTPEFRTKKSELREAYDSLLPSLDALARAGHPGAEAIVQNRESALQLVATNFDALAGEWTTLLAKYRSLITRAIYDPARPLVGINDLPIGEAGSGAPELYQVTNGSALNLHLSSDLRTAVDSRTTINGLAEGFAFTEYVIRAKLTSSVALGIGSIGPFVRQSDGASIEVMGNDQHTCGLYPTMYFTLLRHRAVLACLAELIDQLKAQNIYNDTVIRLAGEFTRNPRGLIGSDHGFRGQVLNLYSGAFSGPLIIGNLRNDGNLGWGSGGKIPELGRQLNLNDSTVTLAHLLRVPAPLTSASPVVTLSSGGLVSNIGKTTQVAA
jgi:hypothetical protein